MILEKIVSKTKCDIGSCRNRATYYICDNRTKMQNRLNICDSCTEELKKIFGNTCEKIQESVPPKSPENMIKKAIKARNTTTIKEQSNEEA